MAKHMRLVSGARPFLKWAGGKSQLLGEFGKRLPEGYLKNKTITRYVEPFIGGGAVFFYLNQRFSFEQCTIADLNEELVLTYRVIRKSVNSLIGELEMLESAYLDKNEREREAYYYEIRDAFNRDLPAIDFRHYNARWIWRAAQIIFLNHTCYNGLFRVNRNGGFNVPFGRYKNPDILNVDNLMEVAARLENTRIIRGDFTKCRKYVDDRTFVYFDPPYRPLNATSSFTTYSRGGFSDKDQKRLAKFFRELDRKGATIMLSNSDPGNEKSGDSFFDDLYAGYTIERVPAKRMINCNGARRGAVSELVITNYGTKKA
ncbi:DNA adenine methylase [Methanoregula sp.]|jgi:DNA adenine methylase|uniref:DNA adenine methylase n=1 Tax=Methanoregula sp. TaxID=2052170 RepID=UPI0025CBE8DE|nr:DNA adenine methylase [Methanoregula sp.]